MEERIQKARSLLAQAKLHVASAPEGGYSPGSLEALRIAELRRAVGLLMNVDVEKAASSPPDFEVEGKVEATRSSSEVARVSTVCTQGHQGMLEEVGSILDQMESLLPTGGAALDEPQSTRMLELRRRVVEILSMDDELNPELPPQYIPPTAQPSSDNARPSPV